MSGLLLRVGVNSGMVNLIVPYTTPGGLFFVHIHPGSYLLLIAGALSFRDVISRTPKQANPLFWGATGLIIECVVAISMKVGLPSANLPFVMDSLLVAPMSLFALANLSIRQQFFIGRTLIAMLLINGGLSIVQTILHRQILPQVLTESNFFAPDLIFRPNGLFDHPLTSGMIMLSAMPLVFIFFRNLLLKWSILSLLSLSIVISQDRVATVGAAVILIVVAAVSLREDVRSRIASVQIVVVGLTLSMLIVPAIITALYASGLLERLFAANDNNSAAARIAAYDIFKFMTPSEFYWGMPMDRALTLGHLFLDLVAFESPIVIYVITFGVYFAAIILPAVYFFVISISLGSSLYVKLSVMAFLIVASTNPQLGTADPGLIIVSTLAFLAASHYRFAISRTADESKRLR
jgi:hypothetical protein